MREDGADSVLSPSQKTTSVFRGLRVATFRLSVRLLSFRLLLVIMRRLVQDPRRAAV